MGLRERMRAKLDQFWRDYLGSDRFWTELRADLDAGRHPTPRALGKALRSGKPVPDWAADYIAGRLTGPGGMTITIPRGYKNWSPVGLNAGEVRSMCPMSGHAHLIGQQRRNLIVFTVRRWERGYAHPRYERWRTFLHQRKRGRGSNPPHLNPYQAALDKAEQVFGIKAQTLDKWVYPRREGRRSNPI